MTKDEVRVLRAAINGRARTRFAPSPTGYLHLGHLLHLVYLFEIANEFEAEIVLRIEDHDRERSKAAYEASILSDLSWLGYASSPRWLNVEAFRQSDHLTRYTDVLGELEARGVVYNCDCSRRSIRERVGSLSYDGHCRERGLPFVAGQMLKRIRLESPEDFSILDRAGNFTYLFTNGIDDLHEGINLVVRGMDLFDSTPTQVMFRRLLGAPTELVYVHHPVLLDEHGEKLSKRTFAESLRTLSKGDAKAAFALLTLSHACVSGSGTYHL